MEGERDAYVFSGGCTNCVNSGGILFELATNPKFNVKNPAVVVLCSGSVVAGIPYAVGKYNKIETIVKDYISGKNIINPRNVRRMVNTSKLIDALWKECFCDEDDVVDENLLNKFFASSTIYVIPVTNFKTGAVEYFSNRDEFLLKDKYKLKSVLDTSIYVPFAARLFGWSPPVIRDIPFFDSSFSGEAEPHGREILRLNKEKNLGLRRLLFVNNSNGNFSDAAYNFWFRMQEKEFKEGYSAAKREFESKKEEMYASFRDSGINIHTMKLDTSGRSLLDNDEERLMKLLKEGKEYVRDNESFCRFMKWND
ncbi:MAG: hypothetical protein OQK82_06210 [Candidatus Pacearchaeota archaeon]|nr:hypothetical protein [Candidatus Pacearchaeota archaeon]